MSAHDTHDDAKISNILREVLLDKKDTHSDFHVTHGPKIETDAVNLLMTMEKIAFQKSLKKNQNGNT